MVLFQIPLQILLEIEMALFSVILWRKSLSNLSFDLSLNVNTNLNRLFHISSLQI